MPVTIASPAGSPVLQVLGGELRPLTPAGQGLAVPAYQVHAYRNGAADCRFLTITGPGRGREFFERADAEVAWRPDMDVAVAVAARFGLEVL
jgi:hypothetical protein